MPDGWIKLWRKLLKNPWLQDAVQRALFVTLLLDAETEPHERRWGNYVIHLKRGQALLATRAMATELKVGRHQIRRAVENLKKGGLINPHTGPAGTVITICNFNYYQELPDTDRPTDRPANRPTSGPPPARLQEGEEGEEGKKEDKFAPNGASKKGGYAFVGKVVRLTGADFKRWHDAYPNIDLIAELTALDDHYDSTLSKEERKNWYPRCSQALANRHERARLARPQQADDEHWGIYS